MTPSTTQVRGVDARVRLAGWQGLEEGWLVGLAVGGV
jgi:hypothetical protein